MAKLFQEQWYNGDEMDASEIGYVLDHNKVRAAVQYVLSVLPFRWLMCPKSVSK